MIRQFATTPPDKRASSAIGGDRHREFAKSEARLLTCARIGAYMKKSIVMASGTAIDRERERVREIGDDLSGWRRWGPYVSDRSWGTVREDYSHDGNVGAI
jgi:hypothetical protein